LTENGDTEPQKKPTARNPGDPLGLLGWVIGGKYKVRSYVGGGGFGEIYEGYNLNLVEQRVIIKFFKRVQVPDKFDKEAKILCVLDHPNISRVIDYLPVEGALVIQYIDGKDISRILNESGELPERMWMKVARSLTDAIAYAHSKKIAHRDIKPTNILIDQNENVYLIDFGIAKEIGGTATKTGYQALTPMFAAPERQKGGKEYNPFLSDIYELGITLYNCATLSMPYRNPISPSFQEWGGQPAKSLSSQAKRVLRKATHPNPDRRYKSAQALADDIQTLTSVYVRPRRWPIVAAIAVIALGAAAFFARGPLMGMFKSDLSSAQSTIEPALNENSNSPSSGLDQEEAPVKAGSGTQSGVPAETRGATADGSAATGTSQTGNQTSQETVAKKPEQAAEQVPPPSPSLRVSVSPGGISRIDIDGKRRQQDETYELENGNHVVALIHPNYPVFTDRLKVSDPGTTVRYDLGREYTSTNTVEVLPVIIPPTDDYELRLTLNGQEHIFEYFPVLDFTLLEGTWEAKAEVFQRAGDGGTVTVDSCVANPMGNGPRASFAGSQGRIRISPGQGEKTVRLFVYWSR
jgi:serine/threonine protein kinase